MNNPQQLLRTLAGYAFSDAPRKIEGKNQIEYFVKLGSHITFTKMQAIKEILNPVEMKVYCDSETNPDADNSGMWSLGLIYDLE